MGVSVENIPSPSNEEKTQILQREATPDLISSSPVKEVPAEEMNVENINEPEQAPAKVEAEESVKEDPKSDMIENDADPSVSIDRRAPIINSEEEAKARMAKKRREVKEQKEREAEQERQRLVKLTNLYKFETI
jgi:hypothetical protein